MQRRTFIQALGAAAAASSLPLKADSGQGVVLLTDMFGGTPSNLAIASMPLGHAVVLAGVNLPMLIKLASVRGTMPLLEAAREAETAGRKYIQLVSENLASGQGA